MPTKKITWPTGIYIVGNPMGVAKGVEVITCVDNKIKCGELFYEGDTVDLAEHAHWNATRHIRDGYLEAVK